MYGRILLRICSEKCLKDKYMEFQDIYEDYEILKSFNNSAFYDDYYPRVIEGMDKLLKKVIKKIRNSYLDVTYKSNIKETIMVVPPDRFSYIIKILSKHYNIVTFSALKELRQLDNVKSYYQVNWQIQLFKGFQKKDIAFAEKVVEEIQYFIKKNNIKVMILGNDRLFIERAYAIAAKRCGVTVIILQHGIYIGEDLGKNKIAVWGDQFWCWSQSIKDMYLKAFPVDESFVSIIGYPFQIIDIPLINKKRVLFMGQYYANLNPELAVEFNEVVRNTYAACEELDLEFVYRMHPSEQIKKVKMDYADLENFHISNEKILMNDIANSFIIIGDVSSTLTEAGLANRNVIQITWNDTIRKNAKNGMYDFAHKAENSIQDIKEMIHTIIKTCPEVKMNEYFLYKNPNIEEFLIAKLSNF